VEAGYVMQYCGSVTAQRYHNLRAGLLDPWEVVLIFQDMIEAQCLPQARLEQAAHLVAVGLCQVPDQMNYH